MTRLWLFVRLFFADAFRGGQGHQTIILWRAAGAITRGNIAFTPGAPVKAFLNLLDVGRLLGKLP